jgi:DNA-directed RNA polymerase specialized sigma24 family protein
MTPLATDILHILPGLRRYAFALTGSRRSGDEYIRVALEALLQEPWRSDPGGDVKFMLYEFFHRALEICDLPRQEFPEASDPHVEVKQGLLRLPLLGRKLVLLVTLEGFSLERAAALVHVPEREAELRVAVARRHLHSAAKKAATNPATRGSRHAGLRAA